MEGDAVQPNSLYIDGKKTLHVVFEEWDKQPVAP